MAVFQSVPFSLQLRKESKVRARPISSDRGERNNGENNYEGGGVIDGRKEVDIAWREAMFGVEVHRKFTLVH